MSPSADTLGLVGLVGAHAPAQALARRLAAGGRVTVAGAQGSSTTLLAGVAAHAARRTVMLVVAHVDECDEARDELESAGLRVIALPALEALPGETQAAADQLAERLSACRDVLCLTPDSPAVVIAPIHALMQVVPQPALLPSLVRTVREKDTLAPQTLAQWLVDAGYRRATALEGPGEFTQRGGLIDVFSPAAAPVRIDFFGDEIDSITEIDLETMGSDRRTGVAELIAADPAKVRDLPGVNFLELVPASSIAILAETAEVVEQGRGYFERVIDQKGVVAPPAVLSILEQRFHALAEVNQFSTARLAGDSVELPIESLPSFSRDIAEAFGELAAQASTSTSVVVACQNEGEQQRFGELLAEHAPAAQHVTSCLAYLHSGFILRGEQDALALVPYHELLHRFTVRRRAARIGAARAMDTFLDFSPGDFVVHTEHGIARFVGLSLLPARELPAALRAYLRSAGAEVAQEPEEFLTLEFSGGSKLHVPVTQIDRVQKYVGGFSGKPPLSTLGGQKWKNQKERVSQSVRELAAELLRVRAAREHMPGVQYAADTPWQREFEAEFPYTETEDQLSALASIKKDMQSPRPMDRLVCGDVGFGKTELAIRAAFKACEFGKQVAVLVPTTVLAEQHERTFRARFAGYPFRIESLSRFKSPTEARAILSDLRKGQVDVVIGTHRLLSKDVTFADLGLVIIDEEQRFGVEHKERLLHLRLTVDILTLSATPIPRTLHMAMLGIRDISSLTTAPVDRRAIVTEVIPWNPIRIRQAIERELARDGQVFFVHNYIHDLLSVCDDLHKLVPHARIVHGHGQMDPEELEEVMLRFMRRDADILVSTTIIESGIDIPTANTIIVNEADRFGLAELHQLRGRVGRSRHRGYCYLLLPDDRAIKEKAQKRLKAIEQFSMLGAGFKIAMRDLEIRGAGNILGPEQSGHIAAVGYEMYCQLLERAVHDLSGMAPTNIAAGTSLEIGIPSHIPRAYIPSDTRRLEAYRRLAAAADPAALQTLRADLTRAYGEPPRSVIRLLDLAELRLSVAALGVKTITVRGQDVVLACEDSPRVAELMASHAPAPPSTGKPGKPAPAPVDRDTIRALPPKEPGTLAEVYYRISPSPTDAPALLRILRRRFGLTPTTEPPGRDAPKTDSPDRSATASIRAASRPKGPSAPRNLSAIRPPRSREAPGG